MLAEDITPQQLANFSTLERVGSVLSLAGCAFIAITFLTSKAFHKPINRLVFYASMGNVFTNIATIIARAAVETKHYNGALCQFQSFLIQMFMPADAYWTFAMALNVYLTFYYKFGADQLRRLEKYYFLACYGVPFVPALAYLFVTTQEKGHMYGNATLWCWISSEWDIFRIVTFYGPVWVVILGTISIYSRAGKDIFKKRQQLRNFSQPPPDPIPIMRDPFSSVKTTEIFITSESAVSSSDEIDLKRLNGPQEPEATAQPYGNICNVTTAPGRSGNQQDVPGNLQTRWSYSEKPLPSPDRKGSVPASAFQPNAPNSNLFPTRRYATMEANTAIWSYTKVAVLFFFAMMITWIPSSANRVFSVVHPGEVSLALEYASSFVLPLQGFWNALIYAMTSLPACKQVWTNLKSTKRFSGGGLRTVIAAFSSDGDREYAGNRAPNGRKGFYQETESMTELQQSRPTSSPSRPQTKDGRP
ncbi:family A G protein-coupled receptor-like protein [Hyaloscypha variabilis F]|uniref:Family A G protein-coupled receptor-like protein n=1 Tax=Hyaloscypha variabilis (strain UAMH 11265 / GT02V1 / F) TaxID=1149755 RepID=A0A2J6R785_HYAVF|nr:family A G protein-coupled receptor-like protein [Hyaloscypha variabilis F]